MDWAIKLREVEENDAHLLFQWRNEESAVRNSTQPRKITWDEHQEWLKKYLRTETAEDRLFIGEIEPDRPCGMVRFDTLVDGVSVSIIVDEYHRGRGVGKSLLREALQLYHTTRLFATVRGSNVASLIIFLASGFQLVEYNSVTGLAYLKREPK